jgi:hypothetical protein
VLERRGVHRLRTYLGGKIWFNAGYCVVDCLVRDLSPSGAKLSLYGTAVLPDRFQLIVPKNSWKLKAEVIWRTNDRVGVTFVR